MINQSNEHRHPGENYSFTFKCLAALAVIVAVIAVPLLIIPLLAALLFYALFSNNRPAPHVHHVRENRWLDGICAFFRPSQHAHSYPTGHVHPHGGNIHHHQDSQHGYSSPSGHVYQRRVNTPHLQSDHPFNHRHESRCLDGNSLYRSH